VFYESRHLSAGRSRMFAIREVKADMLILLGVRNERTQ